jgi:4-amino-4-deoxy-L-arabinose transferase-like glycosyltransferase
MGRPTLVAVCWPGDFLFLDKKMANPAVGAGRDPGSGTNWRVHLLVLAIAAATYVGCIVSPPSLMDDVDAVQAQIARNMLTSGDWVTPRLDGVSYLEKPPLIYWMIALSYRVFGVHDWAARIPMALSTLALCWVTVAFGIWAFGRRGGFYSGLCIATCAGLFLFTRVLIPDVMLTFTTALAMWAFLRALDEEEVHPRLWALVFAASLGVGLLLKSLIAMLFPLAAGAIYLFLTKQFFSAQTWRKLRPVSGTIVILLIAVPWHVLATRNNPPYFSFAFHSGPGEYHGFLWFFFMNEQVLRFLNLRYPRDYATFPRAYFWLFHLLWLFPWSVYLPAVAKLSYKPVDRAGRTRLLALCWIGFLLVFFTFSTTQEYYSMPCYPALALLLGSAMTTEDKWTRWGTRALAMVTGFAALAAAAILIVVRHVPTPGDISQALSRQATYKLSLGHMLDLTFQSFAYLRGPLALAFAAFAIGTIGTLVLRGHRTFLVTALMMVVFFQAARLAMVGFDPYLSSRSLAKILEQSPPGTLIVNHHYYPFSSVLFYTNRPALLLNGRSQNLMYGSYAPGAPNVFIDDARFRELWRGPQRNYLVAPDELLPHLQQLVTEKELNIVATSGGKILLTNQLLPLEDPH